MQLKNRTIRDQEIVGSPEEVMVLGPKLRLENCKIVIQVPARDFLLPAPCDFIGCTIHAKKQLTNKQFWDGARMVNCCFLGKYRGNDFGYRKSWKALRGKFWNYGRVEDCDFTQATLDAVRFLNVDMTRVKLPTWPHFTLLEPWRVKEIQKKIWPGLFEIFIQICVEKTEEDSAVTNYAPAFCKQFKCTEKELRESLSQFPKVLM